MEAIAPRWTCSHFKQSQRALAGIREQEGPTGLVITKNTTRDKVRYTAHKKFRKMASMGQKLAQTVALLSHDDFLLAMENVTELLRIWTAGEHARVDSAETDDDFSTQITSAGTTW